MQGYGSERYVSKNKFDLEAILEAIFQRSAKSLKHNHSIFFYSLSKIFVALYIFLVVKSFSFMKKNKKALAYELHRTKKIHLFNQYSSIQSQT